MGKRIIEHGLFTKFYSLINTIGDSNIQARRRRGLQVSQHSTKTTLILDAYSKLFNKGSDKSPYTAIIDDPSSKKLHLSFQGLSPKFGLSDEQVKDLHTMFSEVLRTGNIDDKVRLFELMNSNGNLIVMRLHNDYIGEIENEIRNLDSSSPDFTIRRKSLLEKQYDFRAFVEAKFDDFLSYDELQKIDGAEINQREIEIFPHNRNNPEHQGVHVEAKGLSYARDQNPTAKEFNIGLSSATRGIPGCCACCSAEFDVLEKHGFIIKRTRDFPDNFPPGKYAASGNITRDPTMFLEFIKKIIDNPNIEKHHPKIYEELKEMHTTFFAKQESEKMKDKLSKLTSISPPPPPPLPSKHDERDHSR